MARAWSMHLARSARRLCLGCWRRRYLGNAMVFLLAWCQHEGSPGGGFAAWEMHPALRDLGLLRGGARAAPEICLPPAGGSEWDLDTPGLCWVELLSDAHYMLVDQALCEFMART
mmetsp:Transcript_85036/g.273733  ORF Transcript_85036/g.273733 Transcript_85036/m.273733 type:complete len:115 (-) Transcript_85036:87-431(-)